MALCEKILIAGFSGAGKSSFLRVISSTAPEGWVHFEDLDHLILKNRGKMQGDLASLIAEVGWEQFRLWERQELEGWLKEEGKGVLALGGGTLSPLIWGLYGKSRKVRFCYLMASFETCWKRLTNSQEIRPLALQGKERLREVYRQRVPVYEEIGWRIGNEEGRDLGEAAREFWGSVSG